MQSVAHEVLNAHERLLIDQAIAEHEGRPGALLGILGGGAGRQCAQISCRWSRCATLPRRPAFRRRRSTARRPFCALQPGSAGRQRGLRLPRDGLPHARLARSAGEALPGSGAERAGAERHQRGRQDGADHRRPRFTVRTVACFGQCALAPVVEVNHHILSHVNERTLQREVKALNHRGGNDAAHSGYWRVQRGA